MIVKKADEEGTTTNADDWGIETDFDLLNNSDLNGFQLDPPLTSNCTMDCLLEFHEVDEIHNQLHF